MIEKWWPNLYLISQTTRGWSWSRKLHNWLRVHSASQPADERDTAVQRLDTTHFYCPPLTLKWKSDDLIFAWSRKLHDGARGPWLGVHSVWQPADERVKAVSKTGHNTLLLPLSGVLCLESVMSDKKCVWVCVCECVCVCVCVCTDSFQAGFPNRFLSVFCTFLRYFRRVPLHMQPKSVSCSSPLACSSHLALNPCSTVLPNTASLPMPQFVWNQKTLTEHCWTSERQLRMSGCLLCLFGWMCSGSIKNSLYEWVIACGVCLVGCVRFQLRTGFNVPATCECISGTSLLRQLYVLPHWDRSCRSNLPSHLVTVYWHRANQSQRWPYNARRLAI